MSEKKHVLSFDEPVNEFEYRLNACPIGNGRIGAMFTGGPARDLILLNHERLRPLIHRETEGSAVDHLNEVRALCLAGKWEEGNEIFSSMVGQTGAVRTLNSYHPVGDLILELNLPGCAEGYRRLLDLERGFGEVCFTANGIDFRRRYFASVEENVIVIQLETVDPDLTDCGAIDLRVSLGRMPVEPAGGCEVHAESNEKGVCLSGIYSDGTSFHTRVDVLTDRDLVQASSKPYDGPGEIHENYAAPLATVGVHGAHRVSIYIQIDVQRSGETDQFHDHEGVHGVSICAKSRTVEHADTLFKAHCEEYGQLFGRAAININPGRPFEIHANKLLRDALHGDPSPGLYQAVFDMGRYLLLSSSRNCSEPANLQGIWNHTYTPPWQCRYQLDVNLQANYWAASVTGLPECNNPLFSLLERLVPASRRFAKDLYGCEGILFGVATDGVNVRYPSNVETQCIAGWLARHFWDHYLFTLDRSFLETRAYPFMQAAGSFLEEFLFKDAFGRLVVLPSNSPENTPGNRTVRLSKNATIDCAVARELFTNLIEAAEILKVDSERVPLWRSILDNLPVTPVSDGLLAEWADEDAEENQHHRHLSHLYGLFPGDQCMHDSRLIDATVSALEARERANMGDACSFTYIWAALLYARAGRGNEAYERLRMYCRGFLMENFASSMGDRRQLGLGRSRSANLASHIFQIESCLAATAAIAEMLIQSDSNTIHILPALPDAWPDGEYTGLCARGGFAVSAMWQGGRLRSVEVCAQAKGVCTLRLGVPMYGTPVLLCDSEPASKLTTHNEFFSFSVLPHKVYALTGDAS